MTDKRDKAARLLVNYFEAIAKKAGMRWDPDYTSEISEAVDLIVEAAVEKATESSRGLSIGSTPSTDTSSLPPTTGSPLPAPGGSR